MGNMDNDVKNRPRLEELSPAWRRYLDFASIFIEALVPAEKQEDALADALEQALDNYKEMPPYIPSELGSAESFLDRYHRGEVAIFKDGQSTILIREYSMPPDEPDELDDPAERWAEELEPAGS